MSAWTEPTYNQLPPRLLLALASGAVFHDWLLGVLVLRALLKRREVLLEPMGLWRQVAPARSLPAVRAGRCDRTGGVWHRCLYLLANECVASTEFKILWYLGGSLSHSGCRNQMRY